MLSGRHEPPRRHILDATTMPAAVGPIVTQEAQGLALAVAAALGTIGVLTVEFFLKADGSLLVNEIAPRPHNSGHLTIEARVASQFERQVRALCGLPLGETELVMPAAMVNLLGDLGAGGRRAALGRCACTRSGCLGASLRKAIADSGSEDGPYHRTGPRSRRGAYARAGGPSGLGCRSAGAELVESRPTRQRWIRCDLLSPDGSGS